MTSHKILTDPELHEPKGVSSASANTVYVSNGSGSGVWTTTSSLGTQYQGWSKYVDDNYTGATSLVIGNSGAATKLLIDGVGETSEAEAPTGATDSLWNTSTNVIEPIASNDFYLVHLGFTVSVSTSLTYFVAQLNVGGSSGVVWEQTLTNPRGVGEKFNLTIPAIANADFVANGGSLYLYKSGTSMSVQDMSVTIARLYKG